MQKRANFLYQALIASDFTMRKDHVSRRKMGIIHECDIQTYLNRIRSSLRDGKVFSNKNLLYQPLIKITINLDLI